MPAHNAEIAVSNRKLADRPDAGSFLHAGSDPHDQ